MDGYNNFFVVFNGEKHYSIWPVELPVPAGWSKDGFKGKKYECLNYIKKLGLTWNR